jgi:hypothetical protein
MSHYDEEQILFNQTSFSGGGGFINHFDVKQPSEMVNHPSHYNKHPSGIECKDVIEHFSYHLGCAVKYIWRCDEKGLPIQDLEKAIKSIQFEIDMRQRKR